MVLEEPWNDSFKTVIAGKNIARLRLSFFAGWKEQACDFVKQLRNIKGLDLISWDVKDVSPIEELTELQHLHIECGYRKPPDFSKFSNLKQCTLAWRPKSDGLFSITSLERLHILNYPYPDLTPLKSLASLTELKITTSRSLSSLSGIESFIALETLELFRCPKLDSLEGMQNCRTIKSLDIETCKGLKKLDPVGTLTELRTLSISNSGDIQSLKPLENLVQLERLFFIESTNIIDGDMSVCKELPALCEMWFRNRRHYSDTREAISDHLAANR